jgi:hypothetical protein
MTRLLKRTTFLTQCGLLGHHKGSCLARTVIMEIPPAPEVFNLLVFEAPAV